MTAFSYLTIQAPAKALYKEKGSKFLAFAYPVISEEEIKANLKFLKKEYFDARHHGYAYVLGPGKERHRAFDDGEPGHSTGDPILGQIRSKNLTNVLVVVVRYFGGIKLGVGGLIGAYRTAAADALNQSAIVEREVTEIVELYYDYGATPEVMKVIKEFDINILSQNFNEECQVILESKLRYHALFLKKMKLLMDIGVKVRVENN